ncbi:protein of unknown function [Methylocaldum szegediense]|uniref:Uncharacterized protein n=1 Tax=Methylocaldum szegediense TaxID=73780 RepID=A0ABM9I987_9GAMM|nr:protein of unknown function [Methylocaldum szegediense]
MARPPNVKTKTPREASANHPRSAKRAIAAFCYRCMGGEDTNHPNIVKAMVRDCESTDCPLWKFRGFQRVTTKGKGIAPRGKSKPI